MVYTRNRPGDGRGDDERVWRRVHVHLRARVYLRDSRDSARVLRTFPLEACLERVGLHRRRRICNRFRLATRSETAPIILELYRAISQRGGGRDSGSARVGGRRGFVLASEISACGCSRSSGGHNRGRYASSANFALVEFSLMEFSRENSRGHVTLERKKTAVKREEGNMEFRRGT